MFKIFGKKEDKNLYAPVTGKSVALEEVPDPVFAEKMMGDGIAFDFEGNHVCAPCDGKVSMIANTLHAFGLVMDNGAEILIHIGFDTVNLNGEGFKALITQGTKVKKGTPIIEIDRAFMKEKEMQLLTPMVITNGTEYKFNVAKAGETVTAGESTVVTFE